MNDSRTRLGAALLRLVALGLLPGDRIGEQTFVWFDRADDGVAGPPYLMELAMLDQSAEASGFDSSVALIYAALERAALRRCWPVQCSSEHAPSRDGQGHQVGWAVQVTPPGGPVTARVHGTAQRDKTTALAEGLALALEQAPLAAGGG